MSGDVSRNFTTNPNGKGRETLFIPTDGLTGYNRYNNTAYGNLTLLESQNLCGLTTCDLTLASFDYRPSLGGNAFYAATFGIYLVLNIYLGLRHKTWVTWLQCSSDSWGKLLATSHESSSTKTLSIPAAITSSSTLSASQYHQPSSLPLYTSVCNS